MEPVILRPEREYLKLMFVIWSIVLCAVLAVTLPLTIFIPKTEAQIFFGIISTVFLAVMILNALWIPAFFKILEYGIDSEGVKMNKGVFWKKRTTVPYHKITNVDITQGPLERHYGIGTIHVQTAGAGGAQGGSAELTMSGVRNIEHIKDIIMEGVKGLHALDTVSASAQNATKTAHFSDHDILKSILEELKAIRRELK